jgi:hypothetical protein
MSKKMVEKRRKKRKKECEEEVGISKHLKILCVWGAHFCHIPNQSSSGQKSLLTLPNLFHVS